jgi:hypothetical protein
VHFIYNDFRNCAETGFSNYLIHHGRPNYCLYVDHLLIAMANRHTACSIAIR